MILFSLPAGGGERNVYRALMFAEKYVHFSDFGIGSERGADIEPRKCLSDI